MIKKFLIIGILLFWPWMANAQTEIGDLDILGGQGVVEVKEKPKTPPPKKAKPPKQQKKEIAAGGELQALEEAKRTGPDSMKATYEILETRYRYWELAIRNLELEYMVRCYQDRRYIQARQKLDGLRNQINRLLIH